jgi:hypothetical protein
MKNLIFFFVSFFVLSACMTDRRNVRRLDGDWKIATYKQTDKLGFTNIVSASGSFHFQKYKLKDEKGTYSYDFSYFLPNDTVSFSESGEYYSAAKQEAIFLNSLDESGKLIQTEKFHIDILTTTDVIFQYNDLNVMHTFVLQKLK